MYLFTWLPLLLFAALGLAETVGYWTLHDFLLFCDGSGMFCLYRFSITEDQGSDPAPGISGTQCIFTVSAQDGSGKAANQTDFQDTNCSGLIDEYKINGGWSPEGFLTVVVTNEPKRTYAFFAYDSHSLEEAQTVHEQTRMAYKVGTFEAVVAGEVTARQDRAAVGVAHVDSESLEPTRRSRVLRA